jgi:hypothetical protein
MWTRLEAVGAVQVLRTLVAISLPARPTRSSAKVPALAYQLATTDSRDVVSVFVVGSTRR